MATEDLGNLEWERSKISQQVNLLKKLGISGKQDALRFPKEESYPAPPMQYRVSFVDHLIRGLSTPIHDFLRGLLFIVAYNIGGVVICVRLDVEYFDVKFPDSVQWWRKKWLYIREENHGSVEDNIPPFDGAEKICRRRSWDAEATDAEKAATEALMTRIHELQNTRGQELSGIQITAYFLRIRVQPLQARKNPLWMYAGDKDVDRLSTDLSVNDLAKLVRKISSLNKKDSVPTSCGVTPYSATNALPQVEKLKKGPLSLTTTRVRLALRVRPQVLENLRHPLKRTPRPRQLLRHARLLQLLLLGAKGKGTRLLTPVPPKPVLPVPKLPDGKKALDLYEAALISSGDEEEDAPIDETARTSTSRTLVVSEARPDGDETSPPQQNPEHPTPAVSPQAPSPKRARVESTKEPTILAGCSSTPLMEEPFMKELIRFGTQFIGYRDYAAKLEERLFGQYSRNWTKSTPKILFFPGGSNTEGGRRRAGGHHTWAARPHGRAGLVGGHLALLRRLFAYLSPFDLKTQYQLTKLQKDSRGAAAIAKLQFGGQNSLFRHLRDGEVPPEAISIDATASIMLRE
ncbi:hypothetical protein QYE76_020320 [Lolium multiflorum]|uniref:Uncharacterized protein n=1 Tax=Lolium multiflorum TaxID=4521 RepID=A0AAD8R8M6_LOLMU|nr:hypothetical protein QYE76_020320 [Lolium multiflorum]